MSINPLNDISKVYLEQVIESAVPGKPAERLGAVTAIPKSEQDAARERILAKTKAKREKMKTEDIDVSDVINERSDEPGERDSNPDVKSHNRSLKDKQGKRMYPSGRAGYTRRPDISKDPRWGSVDEALDPVGQEDADIDNDGDTDSSDKYLHKRRKAIGKAMKKEKMKESFSNWRQDLAEVMDDVESNKEVKEKKVNNKIKINPEMKESVEQLGGELIEMIEVDEAVVYGGEKKEPKDTRYTVTAADKKANTPAYQKYKSDDKRYKAAPHLGEEILDEKALSKQQQKFMGMVYAVKKGEMKAPSPEVAKAASGMSKKSARDFAKTKHKGLPQVKEQIDEPMDSSQDKTSEMQKKKIQVQKVRDLTTRLQAARKGVY